jgi:hypothetical protein
MQYAIVVHSNIILLCMPFLGNCYIQVGLSTPTMQYAVVILLIVILEIVAGIFGFIHRGTIVSQCKCSMCMYIIGPGRGMGIIVIVSTKA